MGRGGVNSESPNPPGGHGFQVKLEACEFGLGGGLLGGALLQVTAGLFLCRVRRTGSSGSIPSPAVLCPFYSVGYQGPSHVVPKS